VVTRESTRHVGARPGLKLRTGGRATSSVHLAVRECAEIRNIESPGSGHRDVLAKGRAARPLARFGVDEHHHPRRHCSQTCVDVRSHDDAAPGATCHCGVGNASIERDDDPDRMVCVRDDAPWALPRRGETPRPQVSARDTRPGGSSLSGR
jgi:hypothetical protein